MALFVDMLRLTTAAILSLFLLSGSEGHVSTPHEYRRECIVWDNVTHMLEMEPRMELVCLKNAQCTGFDCAGNYTYQGLITLFHKSIIEMCFGVTIHPCHKPVDIQVYVELPHKKTSFRHTSLSDEMIEVKGAKFDIIGGGHADAFINVHMKHITHNRQQYLRIGLRLKVRLSVGSGHLETWPAPLAVQLMRDTDIPVPPCDKSVITPPHEIGICKMTARSADEGGTDERGTDKITPKGSGKSCVTTEMRLCHSGEKCLPHGSGGHGHCVCLNGYSRRHDSDHCTPMSTTAIPIFMPSDNAKGPKKTASKELIIVLCSCVAGIAIIGIAVLLVILRLRKQRARYAQHEQLLNNDDDNDDDPLDLAT